mgnify:CR=1 FL=1
MVLPIVMGLIGASAISAGGGLLSGLAGGLLNKQTKGDLFSSGAMRQSPYRTSRQMEQLEKLAEISDYLSGAAGRQYAGVDRAFKQRGQRLAKRASALSNRYQGRADEISSLLGGQTQGVGADLLALTQPGFGKLARPDILNQLAASFG